MELENYDIQQKNDIKEAIKEGRLYDYICSYGYRLDDDIKRELLLECIAVIDEKAEGKKLMENLREYKNWEI